MPGAFIAQTATDMTYGNRSRDAFADMSGDGAFVRRKQTSSRGRATITADVETEAGTGLDDSFDASIAWQQPAAGSKTCSTNAILKGTGRSLWFIRYDGQVLSGPLSGATSTFTVPVMWGSYGINPAAYLASNHPQQIRMLEYTDWAAVVESALEIPVPDSNFSLYLGMTYNGNGTSRSEIFRVDDPTRMAAARHNKKVRVSFVDGHIEALAPDRLAHPTTAAGGCPPAGCSRLWHPKRTARLIPYSWESPR